MGAVLEALDKGPSGAEEGVQPRRVVLLGLRRRGQGLRGDGKQTRRPVRRAEPGRVTGDGLPPPAGGGGRSSAVGRARLGGEEEQDVRGRVLALVRPGVDEERGARGAEQGRRALARLVNRQPAEGEVRASEQNRAAGQG